MKIINKCEPSKPVFNRAQFEASLRPGDVFYRKADVAAMQVDGLMVFMRTSASDNKYINLLSANLFSTLSEGKEYFVAHNATLALNTESK